jgi:hypothetical protein
LRRCLAADSHVLGSAWPQALPTQIGAASELAHSLPLGGAARRNFAMSQQMVGMVITRLLVDEELRTRFEIDSFEALAELHLRGLHLTPDEIDVFVQSDARLWFGENLRGRDQMH